MDTPLQKLAADGLKQLFQNESPGTSFGGEGELLVKGQRIEVLPIVEHSAQQGGRWLAGVRFDMRIDGSKEPKFSFGNVGVGESTEEAQLAAVQEWRAYFGTAFVAALLHGDRGLDVNGFRVYPGELGIRGPSPEQVAQALRDIDRTMFSTLAPLLSSHSPDAFPMTLNVMVARHGSRNVEGECRLNGVASSQCWSLLSRVSWPTNESSYLFRKYYILKRP
jgi:hypothetical protein